MIDAVLATFAMQLPFPHLDTVKAKAVFLFPF
jgi:hypothetical protein